MRHGLSVLRRAGVRPWSRRPRVRRAPALPPMTTDLRARIALIVERDRARRSHETLEAGARDGTPRRALAPSRPVPASVTSEGAAGVANSEERSAVEKRPPTAQEPIEVRERRIAIDDLGLEVVGRGACDALLLAH